MVSGKDGGRAAKPQPAKGGGASQDLYDTADIRFVMREVATLTERISNLIDNSSESASRLEKILEKIEGKIETVDVKIDTEKKSILDKVEPLQTTATWTKGYIAGLTFLIAIIAYLFHDEIGRIAESIAKMGK